MDEIILRKKRKLSLEIAYKLKEIILKSDSLKKSIDLVGLHGSLWAGLGAGDNYDIDIVIWDKSKKTEILNHIKKISLLIKKNMTNINPINDEHFEILLGTGGLICVRAHWFSEEFDERIGIHVFSLSDVLMYEGAFRRITEKKIIDNIDLFTFYQIEAFLRNYICEAKIILDRTKNYYRFQKLISKYPE